MLEIEMKFPVDSFDKVEEFLQQHSAEAQDPRIDIDRYFNAPDRDFAQTDEALRIRSIGDTNCVTYKGPKTDAETKTRMEVEVALGDGPEVAEGFGQLLLHLGYRFVAVVEKKRRIFRFVRGSFDMEIALDEIEQLGKFVELEILAYEEQMEEAKRVLFEVAKEMGLGEGERRSYLEQLLEKTQS